MLAVWNRWLHPIREGFGRGEPAPRLAREQSTVDAMPIWRLVVEGGHVEHGIQILDLHDGAAAWKPDRDFTTSARGRRGVRTAAPALWTVVGVGTCLAAQTWAAVATRQDILTLHVAWTSHTRQSTRHGTRHSSLVVHWQVRALPYTVGLAWGLRAASMAAALGSTRAWTSEMTTILALVTTW